MSGPSWPLSASRSPTRGEHLPLEALVPAAAHGQVGRLLLRRDARHVAAHDPDGARRGDDREKADHGNVPTFAAELGDQYGSGMFYLMLVIGVLILFSTQLGIFEAMVRVVTDAANARSPRLRGCSRATREVLLPVLLLLLRDHRPGDPPGHAGQPGADVGEHVEPRRAHLPVPADLPELDGCPNRPGRDRGTP